MIWGDFWNKEQGLSEKYEWIRNLAPFIFAPKILTPKVSLIFRIFISTPARFSFFRDPGCLVKGEIRSKTDRF